MSGTQAEMEASNQKFQAHSTLGGSDPSDVVTDVSALPVLGALDDDSPGAVELPSPESTLFEQSVGGSDELDAPGLAADDDTGATVGSETGRLLWSEVRPSVDAPASVDSTVVAWLVRSLVSLPAGRCVESPWRLDPVVVDTAAVETSDVISSPASTVGPGIPFSQCSPTPPTHQTNPHFIERVAMTST